MADGSEDLKTVKIDVEAVIEEVRKKGLLTPDPEPIPSPTPPTPPPTLTALPPPTVVKGRILG